ncbi:MAG: alpha/beta fold hydrolase [Cyclobacteriaceae bacterium]
MDFLFEDVAINSNEPDTVFFKSEYVDFIRINSTISDSVAFALAIYKPRKPSPILLLSHGWHMSLLAPKPETESLNPNFLVVQVDMRGRQYSTGQPDCNGFELYDFYDAYRYVISQYAEYITDPSQVYFMGGSGGGGNGYGLVGKFPDLFCSAMISSGISDYALWFEADSIGEFRDEMIPWIGVSPEESAQAYQSRSGITTVENVLTPLYVAHGETDMRVSVVQSRIYYQKARKLKKMIEYKEFAGVGARRHWSNMTKEQQIEKDAFRIKALETRMSPELPVSGELVVAGFLVTKHFSVFMNSIDEVGRIRYDLKRKKLIFLKGSGKVIWKI